MKCTKYKISQGTNTHLVYTLNANEVIHEALFRIQES